MTKEGLAAASSNLGVPTKSTATRKDELKAPLPGMTETKAGTAGTQALPVDTNPGPVRAPEVIVPSAAGSTPAPGTKFDKKAWMREYMRDHRKGIRRRSKAKEDKQNG